MNKVQVRYITGIGKCLDGYPTPLDVLYESCMESPDGNLFSEAKMTNRYGIDSQRVESIMSNLLSSGYVEKNGSRFKIVNTLWD